MENIGLRPSRQALNSFEGRSRGGFWRKRRQLSVERLRTFRCGLYVETDFLAGLRFNALVANYLFFVQEYVAAFFRGDKAIMFAAAVPLDPSP